YNFEDINPVKIGKLLCPKVTKIFFFICLTSFTFLCYNKFVNKLIEFSIIICYALKFERNEE
ncbi:hypothetical protein, partial [Pseudolactococcus paracarnosus]|uniref:hypothetical protein n=1 Tax=Pseudolactococcus paracarnosus TaxID=2749962 RepID=UPI001FB8F509